MRVRTLALDLDEPEEDEALLLGGELIGGSCERQDSYPDSRIVGAYKNDAEDRRDAIQTKHASKNLFSSEHFTAERPYAVIAPVLTA